MMKACCLITVLIFYSLNLINAQEPLIIYRTWVKLNIAPYKHEGALYQIKDSSIIVSNSLVVQDYSLNRFELTNLAVTNIETIYARRNNSIGRGALQGALAGLAIGVITGFLSGDDPPGFMSYTAKEKAQGYGIVFSTLGLGIGALVGSMKISIPIGGSIHNYEQNKILLKEYSIIKN